MFTFLTNKSIKIIANSYFYLFCIEEMDKIKIKPIINIFLGDSYYHIPLFPVK